jgi:acyl carrier protein
MSTAEEQVTIDEIGELLHRVFPDIDDVTTTEFVTAGLMNSMSSLALVSLIEEEFDVRVSPLDMTPENFASAEALTALVNRLLDE